MNITKKDKIFISKIERAANDVAIEQTNSLTNGRIERNFTHYFANKIKGEIKKENIDVDPFYNKHLKFVKYLKGKVIELDIAVHERNSNENNLIAIELETNNSPVRDDLSKIKRLTSDMNEYGYNLGLYIVFGIHKKAGKIISIEWYKNGKLLLKK